MKKFFLGSKDITDLIRSELIGKFASEIAKNEADKRKNFRAPKVFL